MSDNEDWDEIPKRTIVNNGYTSDDDEWDDPPRQFLLSSAAPDYQVSLDVPTMAAPAPPRRLSLPSTSGTDSGSDVRVGRPIPTLIPARPGGFGRGVTWNPNPAFSSPSTSGEESRRPGAGRGLLLQDLVRSSSDL